MHDIAQIKSFSTHMAFLDLAFNETKAEKAA